MHDSRNPCAGTKPLELFVMQIVPPVIMIKTLDSGGGAVSGRCSMEVHLWVYIRLAVLSGRMPVVLHSRNAKAGSIVR